MLLHRKNKVDTSVGLMFSRKWMRIR